MILCSPLWQLVQMSTLFAVKRMQKPTKMVDATRQAKEILYMGVYISLKYKHMNHEEFFKMMRLTIDLKNYLTSSVLIKNNVLKEYT